MSPSGLTSPHEGREARREGAKCGEAAWSQVPSRGRGRVSLRLGNTQTRARPSPGRVPPWQVLSQGRHRRHRRRRLSKKQTLPPLPRMSLPMPVCSVAKSCPILCESMDCTPPGFSNHGIFQQEYWSGLLFPTPGDLLGPGIEHVSVLSPALAAAKSLQSCPTLCDPIDGSPPGSPVPGILQARTLEWAAISFSNA